MRSVKSWAPDAAVRGEGVVRSRERLVHGVVVMLVQRRESRCRVAPHLVLLLLPPLCSGHHGIGAGLVRRVVQKGTDVVDEQRVERFCDPLLVGEFKRTLEWDPEVLWLASPEQRRLEYSPDALQMHRPNLHHMPHFLALENSISPAPSHARNIQELSAIDHVIICLCISAVPSSGASLHTFASGDADPFRLHLEAQASLVFPQRRRDPWFHAGGSDLAGVVEI